jgi:hypothetical protein
MAVFKKHHCSIQPASWQYSTSILAVFSQHHDSIMTVFSRNKNISEQENKYYHRAALYIAASSNSEQKYK